MSNVPNWSNYFLKSFDTLSNKMYIVITGAMLQRITSGDKMVTFNFKEKKYSHKSRSCYKTISAEYECIHWFCGWLTRYENEFDFLRVRLNGRLVARAATYTGV